MSDLYIEARLQAIKEIASVSCVDIKDADNIASFCDEIYSAIPKLDKIVEELEKLQDKAVSIKNEDISMYATGMMGKAIEIVKQGGVADDVCKWALTDTRNVMPYKTSCDNEDLYDHRWKFCPYCGKKIKVVE